MLVKASGANLATAEPRDFVPVDFADALAVIDDDRAGDAEVDALFTAIAQREGRRPSVEALLHVVAYEATDARVVAHSHPTSVNALPCDRESVVGGKRVSERVNLGGG